MDRKLLKTVQTITTFRNRLADPVGTRRGPPLVRGPQFENRCVNLQTKCEVSNYTHYEHMRSGAKCTNWGSLGHLGVTQGLQQCHHLIERIRLPIRL